VEEKDIIFLCGDERAETMKGWVYQNSLEVIKNGIQIFEVVEAKY
jgi:hypothetical protein